MSEDYRMKTDTCNLGELFEELAPVQWVVPVYQRHYVWKSDKDDQISGMWDDWKAQTEKLLDGDTPRPHYFGAIIYSNNEPVRGEPLRRNLVDGQQRLTTFQLALAALRDTGTKLEYDKSSDINAYIFNISSNKDKPVSNKDKPENLIRNKHKLWPSQHDRETFKGIVAFNNIKPNDKTEIKEAYERFCKSIENFVKEKIEESEEETVENLIETLKTALLETFQVVLIALGKYDNAQQIFGSLNGKAEPLSPFDLIRNDIFYRAHENNNEAEKLFENKWFYFENKFWSKQAGRGRLKKARADHFVIDVVVAQTARVFSQHRIATEYRNYARNYPFASVSEELDILINYGKNYRALSEQPEGSDTNQIANLLNWWSLSTINPLVLWISTRSYLEPEEKQTLFIMIENYIVRRHICNLTPNSLNKTVVSILIKMHKAEKQGESIIDTFKEFLKNADAETTKMPTDNDIITACEQKPIYNYSIDSAKKLKYIIAHIEVHIRNKRNENITIETDDLSIEHIMPQGWAEHWALKDGTMVKHVDYWSALEENPELDNSIKELMEKRNSLIHTIGNLTLVTLSANSSLSNDDWQSKKAKINESSLLKLNHTIAKQDEWNEDLIKARSAELAGYINEIWKHPSTK